MRKSSFYLKKPYKMKSNQYGVFSLAQTEMIMKSRVSFTLTKSMEGGLTKSSFESSIRNGTQNL